MRTNFVATLFVCCAALVLFASPAGAVNFQEDFDTGFADATSLSSQTSFFNATSGSFAGVVTTHNIGSAAPSPNFVIGPGASESGGTFTTGVGASDTDIVAQTTVELGPSPGHTLFGLSVVQDDDIAGDRYRATDGQVMVLYTPSYGVETYIPGGGGNSAHAGLHKNLPEGDEVTFRISTPGASGVQPVTFESSVNGGAFSTFRTANTVLSYDPQYLAVGFSGDLSQDNISFASVPEPSALVLLLGGLAVLALRRRQR